VVNKDFSLVREYTGKISVCILFSSADISNNLMCFLMLFVESSGCLQKMSTLGWSLPTLTWSQLTGKPNILCKWKKW